MSSSQRGAAAMQAVEKGKAAFAAGQPITDNPYRKPCYSHIRHTGAWSLYGFWNMGYNDAKNAAILKPTKE